MKYARTVLGLRGLSVSTGSLSFQHPPSLASPCLGEAGMLGLEEGQATSKALLQELHVGGRGRVFKGR